MTPSQSTDDLVREMPLDEALDKARRYANDEKFKDMPSVSRTLLVAVEHLQADLAARDKTIETLREDARTTHGWLIELMDTQPAAWLTISDSESGHGCYWTHDANEAMRFCRKQDAEQFIALSQRQYSGFISLGKATEHLWYSNAAARSEVKP